MLGEGELVPNLAKLKHIKNSILTLNPLIQLFLH
jgi:hypothetical protein